MQSSVGSLQVGVQAALNPCDSTVNHSMKNTLFRRARVVLCQHLESSVAVSAELRLRLPCSSVCNASSCRNAQWFREAR